METLLELHLDIEEQDGELKIVKAKKKYKGLLFWHEISIEQLKDLICKKKEGE